MQAEIDQIEADVDPDEEVKIARKGGTSADQEEGREEGSHQRGQGTHRCQYLAEDRRGTHGETEDWSV